MPYIDEGRRKLLGEEGLSANPGDLTYTIVREAVSVLNAQGTNFATLASVLGAIEAAKMEIYRRVVGPYEDSKIVAHGDLPGLGGGHRIVGGKA